MRLLLPMLQPLFLLFLYCDYSFTLYCYFRWWKWQFTFYFILLFIEQCHLLLILQFSINITLLIDINCSSKVVSISLFASIPETEEQNFVEAGRCVWIFIEHFSENPTNLYCHDTPWYDEMIWNDMIWNEIIWNDMIWNDMKWYEMK